MVDINKLKEELQYIQKLLPSMEKGTIKHRSFRDRENILTSCIETSEMFEDFKQKLENYNGHNLREVLDKEDVLVGHSSCETELDEVDTRPNEEILSDPQNKDRDYIIYCGDILFLDEEQSYLRDVRGCIRDLTENELIAKAKKIIGDSLLYMKCSPRRLEEYTYEKEIKELSILGQEFFKAVHKRDLDPEKQRKILRSILFKIYDKTEYLS